MSLNTVVKMLFKLLDYRSNAKNSELVKNYLNFFLKSDQFAVCTSKNLTCSKIKIFSKFQNYLNYLAKFLVYFFSKTHFNASESAKTLYFCDVTKVEIFDFLLLSLDNNGTFYRD
jgi:hypothetical protein